MSHDQPGQGQDPNGGRDEFDHFFSERSGSTDSTDPDTTAWADPTHPDADRTQATDHAPYVRPPQSPQSPPYDEYGPAAQGGYYQPTAFYEEPAQRRGAMWAPVAVIVASLAIVAVVIAVILNNSSGKMANGAFTPTATVTQTTNQDSAQSSKSSSESPSSSESSSPSNSSSSSSSPSSDYATELPGSANSCSGSASYGTGPKTSCDFAGVVATLYNAKQDKDGNASFEAKSPTTHDKYEVSCQADKYVTCTTDTGAIVYILRK